MASEVTTMSTDRGIASWRADDGHRVLCRVFETANDAILIADDDGRYVDANPSACKLLGRARDEILGTRVADYVTPQDSSEAPPRTLRDHAGSAGAVRIRRGDGTSCDLLFREIADILPGVHITILRDVSDHVTTRGQLLASEQRLRTVIANAPLIVFAVDHNGEYTLHEGKGVEALGVRPGELVGQSILARQLSSPAARDAVPSIQRALNGEAVSSELAIGTRIFDCVLTPDRDPSGAVIGVTGVAVDVTARKLAETSLSASETRFRAMIERSHDGISLLDASLRTIYQSPAVDRLFGYTADQARALNWTDFVIPADAARLQPIAARLLSRPGETIEAQFTMRHRDGRLRAVELTATNLLHDPEVGAVVTNFRDVTERHAFVQALRASEQRYRRIVEGTSDGVVQTNAHGMCVFANAQAGVLLARPVEQIVGADVTQLLDGQLGDGEHAVRRGDGTEVWLVVRTIPMHDSEGASGGTLYLLTDMTQQKKESEVRQRLASIVEHSDDAIISVGLDQRITSWNRAAEKLYGYASEEVLGRPSSILIPDEGADRALDEIFSGGAFERQETLGRCKDGSLIPVAVTASPIRDRSGRIIGASKIARDLTGRHKAEAALRRTEAQLHEAQKMEAIAALAGGIAHDFNNLLTIIMSCADLVLEDLREEDPLKLQITDILDAGRRASVLTRQLLAFGRKQILEPRLVELHRILVGLERVIERTLREDIELVLSNVEPLRPIVADPSQLEQVILNLVVNARDAMPTGGKLTIETTNVNLEEGAVIDSGEIIPGQYVLLTVTDTGIGMDTHTKQHVFEPFFSTKARTEGSGLGLSTVFGIVRQSGGYIHVYSEVGLGTTFRVYFPAAVEGHRVVAPTVAQELPALSGSETVLIVEDEQPVRRMVVTILRKHGYNVLEAANAGDALLICEQFSGRIDLMITDVVMPRMSGRQLADRLAPLRRDMKVLFMSGYTADAIVEHGVLEPGLEFLQKPLTPASLSRKVREVLDRSSTTDAQNT